MTLCTVLLAGVCLSADPVTLVENRHAVAAVVVSQDAFPVAEHAAQELVYHVQQATGAELPVLKEPLAKPWDGPVVYIGATQAARAVGIDSDSLASEATVLRTIGDALYIVGNDGPGKALHKKSTYTGTLWGVYDILDRFMGVRWLWPGRLGEVIPKSDSIRIPAMDETVTPRFNQRLLRPGLGPKGFTTANDRLAFSQMAREAYAENQDLFLRRHRMGMSSDCLYAQLSSGHGHSFEGWWEKYGAEHPEWFQLLPDGRRGPADPDRPKKFTMCVSNPGLHAKIIELWQEERAKHPGETVNIGIGENDTQGSCACDACAAWDGPAPSLEQVPPGMERSYEPAQASNRYARFLQAVHALASTIDPDVRVTMYAYENYFWAPDPSIQLNKNIVIGFVPWFRWAGWFPRTDAEHQWIKEQWLGWQRSGVSMYYRPNWFLDGYAMPLVYMHQFADAFQFYEQHGMTGTDFDSLQGQWAAQGPNLYLLARIHTRPTVGVDEILNEYYSAFGPAAGVVKEYFDYWERYAIENSPRAAESISKRSEGRFRRYALYAKVADELYPDAVFEPASEMLQRASLEAEKDSDPVYRERVHFLQQGLRHAKQCSATAAVVNNEASTLEERKAAISALIAVRRELESTGIANMDRAAIIETDSWKETPEIFEE
ncbi:MAG: hypothetical protein AMXMBFR84_17660 [Candidatus Hydrogenedentota bacterium]